MSTKLQGYNVLDNNQDFKRYINFVEIVLGLCWQGVIVTKLYNDKVIGLFVSVHSKCYLS